MSRYVNPVPQYTDSTGAYLVGGTLTFYVTGTSTLAPTYSDAGLTTPNPNPITLDSVGKSPTSIFLDPAVVYRVVLKNSSEAVQWDRDPITSFVDQAEFDALSAELTEDIAILTVQVLQLISNLYPIGSIYTTVSDTFDPASVFGGIWTKIGAGRTLVGQDTGDPDFDTVEETGGAKEVVLTSGEIAAHRHLIGMADDSADLLIYGQTAIDLPGLASAVIDRVSTPPDKQGVTSSIVDSSAGTPAAPRTAAAAGHNNLQPYFVVIFWRRDS